MKIRVGHPDDESQTDFIEILTSVDTEGEDSELARSIRPGDLAIRTGDASSTETIGAVLTPSQRIYLAELLLLGLA